MSLELEEDGRWPLWQAPAETAGSILDGYGHIACFVSQDAIEGQRGLSAGVGAEMRSDSDGSREENRLIAERLYEQLSACTIRYDGAPWEPGAGQRLRHPGWALAPQESATCVDFSILFAAMCLRERLAPLLVMLRGELEGRQAAHVMVGVDLGRLATVLESAAPLACCGDGGVHGVGRVVDREGLASDPELLLLDCTSANATDRLDFDAAVDRAVEVTRAEHYRDVHLVDVAVRQACGDGPLPAPRSARGGLRRRLPAPRHPLKAFASRLAVAGRLARAVGSVVVIGESGVGKSEIARDAVAAVDHGLGWVLTASNKATLIASLAEAELVERGWPVETIDAVEREALARDALNRLDQAGTAWGVVIDNADCKPAELRGYLPRPDARLGQKLIVTTTNESWRDWEGEPVDVRPLRPEELELLLEDERLVAYAAGRPLLMHALLDAGHYLKLAPDALAERIAQMATTEGPGVVLRALWQVLSDALSEPACAAAEMLAWLLPDRTPITVLEAAVPEVTPALAELLAAGTAAHAAHAGVAAVSMHRLYGQAIRDNLRDRGADRKLVERLLATPEVRELLLVGADAGLTRELARCLVPDDGAAREPLPDHRRGVAIWALATMQEMHEGVRASAKSFERAMAFLDPDETADRLFLADCLHGRAREANQQPPENAEELASALELIRRAIELRPQDDLVGRSKHRALEGLLLQRHARDGLPFGTDEQVARLREAMAILEQSWIERRSSADVDERLVDRAYFNRGGVRVDLAQRVPDEAPELLKVAERVYRDTLTFRSRTYRDPNPLTAASRYGLATALYYRAILDPGCAADPLLLEATREAAGSLEERRHTDGDSDGNDVVKSALILSKIVLARTHYARGDGGDREIQKTLDELDRELHNRTVSPFS